MTESLLNALKLLATGMGTVFVMLVLVVQIGKLIIIFTNKFYTTPPNLTNQGTTPGSNKMNRTKLAALFSAVEIATKGKGHITSIKKLQS